MNSPFKKAEESKRGELKFLAVEGDGGNQIKIPKQNHCLAETGGRGTLVSTLF